MLPALRPSAAGLPPGDEQPRRGRRRRPKTAWAPSSPPARSFSPSFLPACLHTPPHPRAAPRRAAPAALRSLPSPSLPPEAAAPGLARRCAASGTWLGAWGRLPAPQHGPGARPRGSPLPPRGAGRDGRGAPPGLPAALQRSPAGGAAPSRLAWLDEIRKL